MTEWEPFLAAPSRRRRARLGPGLFSTGRATADLERDAAVVAQPVPSARRLLVTSVRGGAGKTTVSALLGAAFATRRPDPVLVADADLVTGSLTARLGVAANRSLPDLAAAVAAAGDPATAALLPRTELGLWLVPGAAGGTVPDLRALLRALAGRFAVQVLDCGPDLTLGNAVDLLVDAQAVVLVVPATADGLRSTVREVERFWRSEQGKAALATAVVALNPVTVPATVDRKRAAAVLEPFGIPVIALEHDAHLAVGGPIEASSLSPQTVAAATALAAAVLARAV